MQQQLPNELWEHIQSHLPSPGDAARFQLVCLQFSTSGVAVWFRERAKRQSCSPACAALWNLEEIMGDSALAQELVAGDIHLALHRKHTKMRALKLIGGGVEQQSCYTVLYDGTIINALLSDSTHELPHGRSRVVMLTVTDGQLAVLLQPGGGGVPRFAMPKVFPLNLAHKSGLAVVGHGAELNGYCLRLWSGHVPEADWRNFIDETHYILDGNGERTLRFEKGIVMLV
jgi:hypothetical protein